MGLFGTLRGILPPSSRSFHELFGYTAEAVERLRVQLDGIEAQLRDMREKVDEQAGLLESAERGITATDAHLAMFAWQALREGNEDLSETKRRFFRNLPEASGSMRLLQLATVQLLCEFDRFCAETGVGYWLYAGTLIGAVRHGGFIPWDDDIDVGMTRTDVDRLVEAAAASERFEVSVVYDWWSACKQVRFRYRASDAPCFIDVFPFDYTTVSADEAVTRMRNDRLALVADVRGRLRSDEWRPGKLLIGAGQPGGAQVAARFDEAVAGACGPGGYLAGDADGAHGLIWGVDNFDLPVHRAMCFDVDEIMPLQRLPFEAHEFFCPRDPDTVLEVIYGDVYELPADIKGHFAHVDRDELEYGASRAALVELAEAYRRSAG